MLDEQKHTQLTCRILNRHNLRNLWIAAKEQRAKGKGEEQSRTPGSNMCRLRLILSLEHQAARNILTSLPIVFSSFVCAISNS